MFVFPRAEVSGGNGLAGRLSGMGRDGAQERELSKEKGVVTFVPDKDSCVVRGTSGMASGATRRRW